MVTQKRYVDGLKAPRNSLELPVETLSYYAMRSNIPYEYHPPQNTSKKKGYPNSSLVKQLIDEEISKPKESRRRVPSVVAQLMGMDVLPTNKNSIIQAQERKMENASKNIAREEKGEAVDNLTQSSLLNPKLVKKSKIQSPHIKKQDADEANHLKFVKSHPREHPQEEQLQKFKKEFEAWQASKIQKLRWSAEMNDSQRQQSFAQENLKMKKMARNANAIRNSVVKDSVELTCYASPITKKMNMQNRNTSQHYGYRNNLFERNSMEDVLNRSVTTDCVQFTQTHSDCQFNRSSVPTRIVILKPGTERGSNTESWAGSSELVEDNFNIEDFLEEVKERLIQTDNRVRGTETETHFHDRLIGSKEIAQHIAKHARESVTKDTGINLMRSGSTRSHTNEIQCIETGSPEFLDRDTRRLLSERLRNILRNEIDSVRHPGISGRVVTSMAGGGNSSPGSSKDARIISQQEYVEDEHKKKLRLRRFTNDEAFASGELSPRNLFRSLSTPVLGTAFGKLLSEEPPLLTGAHIRRKHEAADNFSKEHGKGKKEWFSFRGRVSNLRHNLMLKGMLFGKKIQTMKDSRAKESEHVEASIALPTVLLNSCSAQENSTEVPPSPASVCSSNHEDFFRPGDHPSPVSPLDISSIEDQPAPATFGEICSKINELRRQLDEIRSVSPVEEAPAAGSQHPEDDLEGPEHAYLRDVLLTAGFYDDDDDDRTTSNPTNSIDIQVHDRLEEIYRRLAKEDEAATAMVGGESNTTHKILFDLLNESLSTISSKTVNRSWFMRRVLGTSTRLPGGNELLAHVWKMVRTYVCPNPPDACQSLDDMVASDLWTTTFWANDEMDAISSELEWMIVGELILEMVGDMVC